MKKIFFYLLTLLLVNPVQAGKLSSFLSKTDGEATLNNTIQQLEPLAQLKSYYYYLALVNRLKLGHRMLKSIKYSRDYAASCKADELAFQLGQYAEKLILKKSTSSKKESILIIRNLMQLAEKYKTIFLHNDTVKSAQEHQGIVESMEAQPIPSNPFQALISYHDYKINDADSGMTKVHDFAPLVKTEETIRNQIDMLPEQQLIGPKIVGSRAKI